VAEAKNARVEALQAILEAGQEIKELEVKVGRETMVFRYRPLGWLAKSKCISEATEYRSSGTDAKGGAMIAVILHQDIYKRMALQEMLVDPPIPMTEKVLDSLPSEVGDQFEGIIPSPFTVAESAGPKKG